MMFFHFLPGHGYLRLYVLLPRQLPENFERARNMIWTALREGRFYNCVDAAAPGYGFRFWGTHTHGRIPMGSSERTTPSTQLYVQVPSAGCALGGALEFGYSPLKVALHPVGALVLGYGR